MKSKLHNTTCSNLPPSIASADFSLDTHISTTEWIYSKQSC